MARAARISERRRTDVVTLIQALGFPASPRGNRSPGRQSCDVRTKGRGAFETFPAVGAGLFGYEPIAVGPFLSFETLLQGRTLTLALKPIVLPFYAAFARGDIRSLEPCFCAGLARRRASPGACAGLQGLKQAV